MFTSAAGEAELQAGDADLSRLCMADQEIITQRRLIEQSR